MSKWAWPIVGVCLILGGCANKSIVIVQAKPPGSAGIDWGKSSLIAPTDAAEAEPCQKPSTPQAVNQPDYRQLTVSLDSSDTASIEVRKEDLKIRDDNREIPLQFFQRKAASVGILVDTSGSMDPKMIQAKATLTDLIDGLSSDDEAFMIEFSIRPFLLQNFTRDHALLKQALTLLHPFGQTAMRDAIIQGLLLIRHGCNQNKALFVMTDGMDNVSSVSPRDMMAAVKQSNVRIFALGIGNKQAHPLFNGPFMLGGDEDWVDIPTLQDLAGSSGGKIYILSIRDDAEAKQTALAIADEIDNQYTIGFVALPTQNSKIQIELMNHPGATLKIEGAPPDVSVVNGSQP
jgi:VWFA-related protein